MKNCWSLFVLCCLLGNANAGISVRDDMGNTIVLEAPARRVVSLAPHVTEMLFEAGAGEYIVGAVNHSNYPAAARDIPRVGDHHRIDIERLVSMQPDLLVVWLHGNASRQLDALRRLGIPLFYSEPNTLADIPNTIERLGQLLGTQQHAQKSAEKLRGKLSGLSETYGGRPPVRVFYQVWDRPLYTLNGSHIVSDAIRLCGGENIFSTLSVKAPTVSVEAVLLENPEAIVSANTRDREGNSLEHWKNYSTLTAAQRGNLFSIDADLINRAGPRMIEGARALCEKIDQARARREKHP